jgi:polyisoprenoid-binding protein YceI
MKRFLIPITAALLLAASAFTLINSADYTIADGYTIIFSTDEASGAFKGFKGTISFDEANPATSRFDVTVDVASLNTGNALQNKHAKSDEWFDAAKYPLIHYTSRQLVKTGSGYQVTGDLEMHGVKKEVIIPFTFKKAPAGGVFAATFTVNRTDFKIGQPGGEVSNLIKVELNIPVTNK